jgi:hypothetical protein
MHGPMNVKKWRMLFACRVTKPIFTHNDFGRTLKRLTSKFHYWSEEVH